MGPSTKNCFIVFLDTGGHGGLRTFYGIEKYCSNPNISRFQNRDYHMLTLRKLAISPIISKRQFLTLNLQNSVNFHLYSLKLHRYTQWHYLNKTYAHFFSLPAGRSADNYVLFFEKKHIIVSRAARRKRKKVCVSFVQIVPLSIPVEFQGIQMKIN